MTGDTLPPTARDKWPNLTQHNHSIASPATDNYNCIAWACGITDKWMWPRSPDSYWPPEVAGLDELNALTQLYVNLGFEKCENGALEKGYTKVVIYANKESPTHAAVQLESGRWSSKLGIMQDVEHTLGALEGDFYGRPVVFLRKRYRA